MDTKERFSYIIQYTRAADKFLNEHKNIRKEYEDAIKELITGNHPERIDVKRIKGKWNNYYRIMLGQYRVIYAIINDRIVVINTILAGSRRDVYRKMNAIK